MKRDDDNVVWINEWLEDDIEWETRSRWDGFLAFVMLVGFWAALMILGYWLAQLIVWVW